MQHEHEMVGSQSEIAKPKSASHGVTVRSSLPFRAWPSEDLPHEHTSRREPRTVVPVGNTSSGTYQPTRARSYVGGVGDGVRTRPNRLAIWPGLGVCMWVCAREEQYGEPNEARYGEADDEGPAPSESRGATIRSLAEKRLQPKRYRRVCEEHKGRCRSWPELEQEWLDHDLTRAPSKLDCRTNGGDRNQGPQWRGALFHLLQHSGGVAVLQRRHGSQRCHGSQGTPQHAVQPAVGRSEGS